MRKDSELAGARWDLRPLYAGIDDKRIDADLSRLARIGADFPRLYKGRLASSLEPAVVALVKFKEIADSVASYFYLESSRDAANEGIKKRMSAAFEKISEAEGNLAFFDIELGKLPRGAYELQLKKSGLLSHNRPCLDRVRRLAKYNLAEEVETILAKLSPFGSSEWDDMMDEMETKLAFRVGKKALSLAEVLHVMNSSRDAAERRAAMAELNRSLASSNYMSLRTRALNLVAGQKAVFDRERGFATPMESRDISNNLDAGTVAALHDAVLRYGAPQGKRYYNIMKRLLGKKVLSWADRNAPPPFGKRGYVPYAKCVETVLAAYENFSPKLAALIADDIAGNRVDAPAYKGKTSGAYNATIVAPRGRVLAYTFLNYMGTTRDVMTFAHELGHAVHGLLAGRKQGALQASAPMAYAETASIFGEMLTFEYMLEHAAGREERLALLLAKAGDWLNSVNRQISFSLFEQRLHEKRKSGKVTSAELCGIWLDVTRRMYGRDGEVFEYKDMENLWCYVGHFMRPFYVYAYSFGELFTQSLFAARGRLGDKFERLYVEMLESGGTRDARALMRPFGLDPTDARFWKSGIDVSIRRWLDEAEALL
jgi:oligoendopeptidase F